MINTRRDINIGVVGLGYWGPNLIRNFSHIPGCQVKYGCDLKQEALDKMHHRYPYVKFTNNYEDLLKDKNLDAIAIATPVSTHYKLAKLALEYNKHVLLEKPMAFSVRECEDLIKISKRKKLVLLVDHTFLFTGAVRKIKEIIDDKKIGKILYFDSVRINLGLLQPDINVIWDLASHDISIMNYLFNKSKPVSVFATGSGHIHGQFEEMAHITINFDTGLVAHIHVSWLSPVKIRKILIGGDKKMIVYDDLEPSEKVKVYDKGVSVATSEITPFRPVYRSGDVIIPKLDDTEALKIEAEHFLQCIKGREKPLTNGKFGLGVVKILEACDKSIKEGTIINI